MYEWKVIEYLGTRTQVDSDAEKQELLTDGFQLFRTMFENERDNIHFNVYRKLIKNKKMWLDYDIKPNLSVKDEEGNIFTIIKIQTQIRVMKGWLILSPTDGVACTPSDSYYFSAWEICKYLNDNGFLPA